MANMKITLTKSLIGRLQKQVSTAHALGLKKINDETIQPNNPQTMGKIARISHLISVEEAE